MMRKPSLARQPLMEKLLVVVIVVLVVAVRLGRVGAIVRDLFPQSSTARDVEMVNPLADVTPVARAFHTGSVVGERLYYFGGYGRLPADEEVTYLNSISLYDPRTDRWSGPLSRRYKTQSNIVVDALGDRPNPRAFHTAAVVEDRYIYVFGGQNDDRHFRDLHRFDTPLLTWSGALNVAGTPPQARAEHCMVSVNDMLFVFGGRGPGQSYNDMFMFDTEWQEWAPLQVPTAAAPAPRHSMGCATSAMDVAGDLTPTSRLFVFGGWDSFRGDLLFQDLWSIDLDLIKTPSLAWELLEPSTAVGDAILSSATIGRVHTFPEGAQPFSVGYVSSNLSASVGPSGKPYPRYQHSMAVAENRVFVWQGLSRYVASDRVGVPISNWMSYDLDTEQWLLLDNATDNFPSPLEDRPKPRAGAAVNQINRRLFDYGGMFNGSAGMEDAATVSHHMYMYHLGQTDSNTWIFRYADDKPRGDAHAHISPNPR